LNKGGRPTCRRAPIVPAESNEKAKHAKNSWREKRRVQQKKKAAETQKTGDDYDQERMSISIKAKNGGFLQAGSRCGRVVPDRGRMCREGGSIWEKRERDKVFRERRRMIQSNPSGEGKEGGTVREVVEGRGKPMVHPEHFTHGGGE